MLRIIHHQLTTKISRPLLRFAKKLSKVKANLAQWYIKVYTAFYEVWTLDPVKRLATKNGEQIVSHYLYIVYHELTRYIGSLAE